MFPLSPFVRLSVSTLLVVSFVLPSLPAYAARQPVDSSAIDRFITSEMNDSNIPGVAVAIVEQGVIVYGGGFGTAGNGNDVTLETPFPIGSLTKSMTALSIMQLVEAGSIDLDAPVQTYLPWFTVADADASATITIRHLLNQTSGFSRATGIDLLVNLPDASLVETVQSLSSVELNRPVGETYEYSNANYAILSLLVQEVSGVPFGDYLQANIFDPLGMTIATTDVDLARERGLTDVYRFWFGWPVKTDVPNLTGHEPAFVSVEDMAAYTTMYLHGGTYNGNQILSTAGIEAMLTPATNTATRPLLGTEFTFEYGMGWFAGPFGEIDDARWHLGELPSFSAWMILQPEQDRAVIVLINAGNQLPLAGANSVMSRIPIGVVNLASGAAAPSGVSLGQFYIGFNLAMILTVAVQVWALFRLVRAIGVPVPKQANAHPRLHRFKTFLPAAWEFTLPFGIILGYPGVIGIGWGAIMDSTPDLAIALLVISGLWLVTGVVRVIAILRARSTTGKAAEREAPQSLPSLTPAIEKGAL